MKKNKGKNVFSKLIKEVQNKSNNKTIHPNALSKHVTAPEEEKSKNLRSNLESKNLDEFFDLAKLSNKQYEVLNEQIVLQGLNSNTNREIPQSQYNNNFLKNSLKNTDIRLYETKPLAIPKRPKWKEGISAVEFDRMEREAFLNWRRALAGEEEANVGYAITPYEKNIEVWRQLWLVVEKSNVLIQIVDGRNPLYFRCPDLEKYIKEVSKDKDYLLLVNKADLMSVAVRRTWADYFKANGIKYAFFSALEEANKIEAEMEKQPEQNLEQSEEEDQVSEEEDEEELVISNKFKALKVDNDEDEDEKTDSKVNTQEKIQNAIQTQQENISESNNPNKNNDELTHTNTLASSNAIPTPVHTTESKAEVIISQPENESKAIEADPANTPPSINPLPHITEEDTHIYDREQLIEVVRKSLSTKTTFKNSYYVGFIGYPNVGKSSVINVLMQKKKVAVALMPGKTKHYQTLFLPGEHKDICLMDCPGLVFPSFTSSRADMAVNGIIPIDTLREFQSPISIIVGKIPRKVLEWYYKIELPDIYSATQFLQILALARGFLTGRSLPDEAKTAKWILKDYTGGKLLYCNLRPDYEESLHGTVVPYDENCIQAISQEEKDKQDIIKEIPADFDDDYEKINIDVDTNRNLTTVKENFDQMYFALLGQEDENKTSGKDKMMNKAMKRALKFAFKRGELTEEEFENAMTVEEYETLVNKITATNKKDLVGVKVIPVENN